MRIEEVDIVVLGMGPGGEEVAGRLAEAGLAVVGVEARLLGGECPYWGCVPTKMMIRAADLLAEGRRIPGMAGESFVRPDWSPVAQRIRADATDTWDDKVAVDRFTSKGGRFVRGFGRITAPGEVTVGGRVFRARRGIVVATGTEPAVPPIPGLAGTPFWTNREAVETEHVPRSLIVLGGGPVGVEFAQVFARFGAQVQVVEARDRLLPGEEPEAGALLTEIFAAEGIRVRVGVSATAVHHDGGAFHVLLDGDGPALTAESLLVATGRRADLTALGMGAVGIDERGRAIPVDERMRAAPGIWALGDVTGKGAFTHVAMYHADIVVRDILSTGGPAAEYHALPRVTFTDPEVGAVGMTEERAREIGRRVRVATIPLAASARGWIHKAEGFVKLVADADHGVLVGATTAGPAGGEVLGVLTLAIHARVPIATLRHMMYAYPTFHRAIEDALRALGP